MLIPLVGLVQAVVAQPGLTKTIPPVRPCLALTYAADIAERFQQIGVRSFTVRNRTQITALVTGGNPRGGYTVVVDHGYAGPWRLGAVATYRTGSGHFDHPAPAPSDDLLDWLHSIDAPFGVTAGGARRERGPVREFLPLIDAAVPVTCGAPARITSPAGPGLVLEWRAQAPLPITVRRAGEALTLTGYRHEARIDMRSGLTVSETLHVSCIRAIGGKATPVELDLSMTLGTSTTLPPAEERSIVGQAEAAQKLHAELVAYNRGDMIALDRAEQTAYDFRHAYRDSPLLHLVDTTSLDIARMLVSRNGMFRADRLKLKPAPPIALKTVTGVSDNLDRYRGKVVLITFVSPLCGHCFNEARYLDWEATHDRLPRGAVVLGVATFSGGDTMAVARDFQRKLGLTYPLLVDTGGRVGREYAVGGVPEIVIVGRDGRVVTALIGFDPARLDAAVSAAAGGDRKQRPTT